MQRKNQELITAPNSDPLKLWEEKLEDHLLEIFLGLYAVVFLMFKMWGPRYRNFSVRKESLEPQKQGLHPRDQRGEEWASPFKVPPKHNLVGGIPTPLKKNSQISWDDGIPNIWKNKIHAQTHFQWSSYPRSPAIL